MNTINLRTSERITVRAKFTLNVGVHRDVEVWSRNMSLGGVYLECPPEIAQDLILNSNIKLTVHYGPGDFDSIIARILRVSPDGVGLCFEREWGGSMLPDAQQREKQVIRIPSRANISR